jgi:hypothetical protein
VQLDRALAWAGARAALHMSFGLILIDKSASSDMPCRDYGSGPVEAALENAIRSFGESPHVLNSKSQGE